MLQGKELKNHKENSKSLMNSVNEICFVENQYWSNFPVFVGKKLSENCQTAIETWNMIKQSHLLKHKENSGALEPYMLKKVTCNT